MPRPFFRFTIGELEAAFDTHLADESFLNALREELSHRSTDRAVRLLEKVRKAFAGFKEAPQPTRKTLAAKGETEGPPLFSGVRNSTDANRGAESSRKDSPVEIPTRTAPATPPPITNQAEQILSAWTAFEVLSPQAFDRPEQLAVNGERRMVASLEERSLPWELGEKSRQGCRLYYQIVLGTIKMKQAVERLIERYGDSRPERPSTKGRGILAVVIVDKQGLLVESPAVAVSSFGWGVMAALKGELTNLARWPQVEPELVAKVEKELRRYETTDDDDAKEKAGDDAYRLQKRHPILDNPRLEHSGIIPCRVLLSSYALGISCFALTRISRGIRTTLSVGPQDAPSESAPFIRSVTSSPIIRNEPSACSRISGQFSSDTHELRARGSEPRRRRIMPTRWNYSPMLVKRFFG